MKFPLRDWIEAHAGCRHDLSSSGMREALPPPAWPRRRPRPDVADVLQVELAEHLGVDRRRLFLTRGATEANGLVLGHLARRNRGRRPVLRVRPPEYPPLYDAGAAQGFAVRDGRTRADVAVVSQPRNPEGDLWDRERLAAWADGAGELLVDETFREFAGTPTLSRAASAHRWTTGSFTKFFGADDVRVGFAVAPPESAEPFARYVGLVADDLAPASAAMALELLRRIGTVRRQVRAVVEPNLEALGAVLPGAPRPSAPLCFDRPPAGDGDRLTGACLRASVLVCPGSLFGDRSGVRLCLTRRDAPASLRAYARVRRAARDGGLRGRARV